MGCSTNGPSGYRPVFNPFTAVSIFMQKVCVLAACAVSSQTAQRLVEHVTGVCPFFGGFIGTIIRHEK